MAASVDFVLTCPPLTLPSSPALSQMRGPSDTGWFESPRYRTGKMTNPTSHSASGETGMVPEGLHESLWQDFFEDPTQWWDGRRSKQDSGMKTHLYSVAPSVQGQGAILAQQGPLQIGTSRKLCDDGQVSSAVDALSLLVQQGCHVDQNLYFRVLKSCIVRKDLIVGRRIHALSAKSGYEGDAFLATQLIGLYASHGRLEEAMQVFRKVDTPSTYNWAAIIIANGRHGEARQAIRLYRQMCESTTEKPSNRVYVAILKACAMTGDLVAGKEIHAHILASPGRPDIYVQTGLVTMYAKCGSLGDARRLFDELPEKDVVAWTAMLAGYAQQGMGQEALNLYVIMQQEGLTTPDSVTFVCLLHACASVGVRALDQGKHLHSQIQERGLQEDSILSGSLVNMYAKCGSLEDARRVFDELPERDVVTWNTMIAGYAQQGMGLEALILYSSMHQEGRPSPDSLTFVSLLQACASVGVEALDQGKQLHSEIQERGLQEHLVLGGSLVNMYAKCGSLEDARRVFDKLPQRHVVAWNVMLAGYAQQGMGQEALSLYSSMQQERLTTPDSVTFLCLLQACATVGVGALGQGIQLHSQFQEQAIDSVLGGSLVNMYAKCGSLEDARRVFDSLQERDVVAWTAMLAGYSQQGMGEEALSLYSSMQQEGHTTPDSVTFVCLLQACASVGVGALDQGKQLHSQIQEQGLQEDMVLCGSLVNMYAKCGSLDDARRLFDRLPERNVVAWNAMLAGYAQQGMGHEALSLYSSMQQVALTSPDSVTYVCLLQACASVAALPQGKLIHTQIEGQGLELDVVVGAALVTMYAKCGSLEDARRVFDRLPERNVVAWNAMLSGYAQQGMGQEALSLYSSMQQEGLTTPNAITYVCLLQACASVGITTLDQGKHLHLQIEERGLQEDLALGGSLVNMYAKCGSLDDARRLFDRLPERNVVAWNSMLAGYAQQGMGEEALSLYRSMQQGALTIPDSVTYVCLLQACASVAALPQGKLVHAQIEEQGLQGDVVVGTALVNMYAKCGSMFDSQQVFDSLPERTVEAWGALIDGYSRQGESEVVFDLIDRMRLEGVQQDGITFLCVLTVCSHVGDVDNGRKYFEALKSDYDIIPTLEHYTCMVDLLGRAGHLDEALQMAKTMPFPPTSTVWHTLLGACRKWNNVQIGQQAFELAVSVDGEDASSYVLMSNIYASAQMWEEAKELQVRRKKSGAWKKPGQSWWTDMGGVVHTFVVGDKKHPESEGIYARLELLVPKMKKAGYVPHLDSALRDIPDDEKEAELCGHSEKLAIAYALNKTPEGTTIRIAKNLRVCTDCHSATAYISKVEKRTIICRDASRFHVYKEGKCSCGDYW